MPLPKLTYQLPLQLDLPVPEEDLQVDVAEARERNDTARRTLEAMFGKAGAPRWLDDYLELMRGEWPWTRLLEAAQP